MLSNRSGSEINVIRITMWDPRKFKMYSLISKKIDRTTVSG